MHRPSAPFTEMAGLLARGYMRLAKKRRNCGVFGIDSGDKELELRAEASPHELADGGSDEQDDA